jgi:hypothetical protein
LRVSERHRRDVQGNHDADGDEHHEGAGDLQASRLNNLRRMRATSP